MEGSGLGAPLPSLGAGSGACRLLPITSSGRLGRKEKGQSCAQSGHDRGLLQKACQLGGKVGVTHSSSRMVGGAECAYRVVEEEVARGASNAPKIRRA